VTNVCVLFSDTFLSLHFEKVTGIEPIGSTIRVPIRMRAWQKLGWSCDSVSVMTSVVGFPKLIIFYPHFVLYNEANYLQ